jgi:hypothetical protein
LVSDRDPVFTSMFWRELMHLMGTKLHMTTAFHPQSDGQSEAANRVIIMYLRCLKPRQWLRWLPWAEFVFNAAYQTSLRDTPFRVVYGHDPPSIRSYEPGDTRVAAVAKTMEEREEFLADVRYRLEQAQATQKLHYDKVHRHVAYQVGDWALLCLRQRAASSLPQAVWSKLRPRFFGPYRVIELINDIAVRLALPSRARLHDVFHVGLLRKFNGTRQMLRLLCRQFTMALSYRSPSVLYATALLTGCTRSCTVEGPLACISYVGRRAAVQRQVSRVSTRGRAASRGGKRCHGRAHVYQDELPLEGGRDVMVGHTYTRRRRARDMRRDAARAEHAESAHEDDTLGAVTASG